MCIRDRSTSEDVVLDVFVNMNTNGTPPSQYDIIAAQLESKLGMSRTEKIEKLKDEVPELRSFSNVSELLFNTESLVQGYSPNQAGAWTVSYTHLQERHLRPLIVIVELWEKLHRFALFIHSKPAIVLHFSWHRPGGIASCGVRE